MTRLDHASEIIGLARELGVGGGAPVDGILALCRRRIDGWVAEAGGVTGIDALEALVTGKLQMVFEEVRADADWDQLKEVYTRGKKEFVFGGLRSKFDDDANPTYGALVRRRHAGADDPDRYVAVIDCRGYKLARRFFTLWHEVAHRLTTHADGGETEPVLHDILEKRYALRPYGWPDEEVLLLLARLVVLSEVSLMMDSTLSCARSRRS